MLTDVLEQCRDNANIVDAFVKADSIINNPKYKRCLCSISGGSDSDIMLDLLTKVDVNKKIIYIWFNTGLEYQATKDHIDYLENRYNIEIIRERAIKPIPLCCKELGQPFLNKRVSEYINRLQLYDFQFEDEEFDVLIKRYPQCRSALRWWCNDWNGNHVKNWGYSMFNINYNRFLKEFLIQNPPQFRISAKCCDYAKKKVGKSTMKKYKIGLSIIGVRKAEGGVRSAAYSGCFDTKNSHHNYDNYRPLFWFTDADKAYYEEKFQIVHSDCYTKWGFTRTGCVGCPYNRKVDEELNTILQYEPKLYKAINNVFNDSYAYTKEYKEFVHKMKRKEWNKKHGRKRLF